MNISEGGYQQKAEAVNLGGFGQAASAQFSVGEIGFGPAWSAEDSMAASIIRLEQENQELNAEVALLREQARILTEERDEARLQYRSTHALAEVMVKSRNEFLEALRDIAKMDTSQEASGGQCAAVWRALEALK